MHHREYVGRVVSAKTPKTVLVAVEWVQHHPRYQKALRRITRFPAHDPKEQCREGDVVRLVEVRPLSKTKRWLVREVVRKGEVVEVKPEEVGRELLEEVSTAKASSPRPAAEVPQASASEASAPEEAAPAGQEAKE